MGMEMHRQRRPKGPPKMAKPRPLESSKEEIIVHHQANYPSWAYHDFAEKDDQIRGWYAFFSWNVGVSHDGRAGFRPHGNR